MPAPLQTRDGSHLFVGLMSGTSMDCIDATVVAFDSEQVKLINAVNFAIPASLRAELLELCAPGANEIERMGAADRQLGRIFAQATLQLLRDSDIETDRICAIGSHGQTIRHRPNQADNNFSLQIGDPNTIAELTGITTVADFRRRDIAANGQGAPLAPAFHHAVFASADTGRAIVNIGGIANVTLLGRGEAPTGFDTGPGNVLMDAWIRQQRNRSFDGNGEWAASGRTIQALLNRLMNHPYLNKPAPKSTGREEFNLAWLHEQLRDTGYTAEDVQATLLDFTASTIAGEILRHSGDIQEIYICGGGACNSQLMRRLQTLLRPRRVATTAALGIPPEWVEGAAFAWLAKRTLEGLPGNLPSVTGADKAVILGAIYRA